MGELAIGDLFAVFRRRKKMILGSIIIAVFISVLVVILIPAIAMNKMGDRFHNDVYLEIETSFNALSFVDSRTLDNYVNKTLSDQDIFLGSLKAVGREQYAAFEKMKLIKKKESYLVTVKTEDSFDTEGFASAFLSSSNGKMKELLLPIAEQIVWGFENITMKHYPEAAYDEKFVRRYNRYIGAGKYLEKPVPILIFVNDPYKNKGKGMRVELVSLVLRRAFVVSVYFVLLTVFIAFAVEWKGDRQDC